MSGSSKPRDGRNYNTIYTAKNLAEWLVCRYTVTTPGGSVVGLCTTRWGARRIIAAHERTQGCSRADCIKEARPAVKP